jgi:hypothetical protein
MISFVTLLRSLLAYAVIFPSMAASLPISKRFVPFVQTESGNSAASASYQYLAKEIKDYFSKRSGTGDIPENNAFLHGQSPIRDVITEATFDKFIDYTKGYRRTRI